MSPELGGGGIPPAAPALRFGWGHPAEVRLSANLAPWERSGAPPSFLQTQLEGVTGSGGLLGRTERFIPSLPRGPGSSLRSVTPSGKVNGLDLGTQNAPSLSLSNVFPLGESFVREIPEVSGGLLGTLCKRTLTVGLGAWGLRCCGPDIAGDSGLRHAPAGAPCKGQDRQPPSSYPAPPHQTRLPTRVPLMRSVPGLQALSGPWGHPVSRCSGALRAGGAGRGGR